MKTLRSTILGSALALLVPHVTPAAEVTGLGGSSSVQGQIAIARFEQRLRTTSRA